MLDPKHPQEPLGAEKPSDLDRIVASIKAHPLQYAAGVLLLFAAGLGFLFYSANAQARSEAAATKLIRAVNTEEPAERLEKLNALIDDAGPLEAEAVYLKGETAFALDEYETARAAFEEVLAEYPDFQFAPDALEGLGYIEEAQGNYEEAVVHYLDVQVKYPDTYAARRQHYNLGRAYGAQGNAEEAVAAFRRQIGEFPESVVAGRAQHKLHQYRASHPELFQEFEETFTEESEGAADTELRLVPDEELEPVNPEELPVEPPETGEKPQ